MKFKNLRKLSEENFRRIIGIKRHTFDVMLKRLNEAEKLQKYKADAPINCRCKIDYL